MFDGKSLTEGTQLASLAPTSLAVYVGLDDALAQAGTSLAGKDVGVDFNKE